MATKRQRHVHCTKALSETSSFSGCASYEFSGGEGTTISNACTDPSTEQEPFRLRMHKLLLRSCLSTSYHLLQDSVAFALFKTYSIPTISKILASTKELKSADSISKRYADTGILIATWVRCPINGYDKPEPGDDVKLGHSKDPKYDPRANLAIARVNWLHSHYNIITLNTRSSQKWVERYGWRTFAPIERHAAFMFWVEVGHRMGIQGIPETPEAFKEWVQEYEERAMYPAQTNHDVAWYTLEELIHVLPETLGVRNFARKLAIAMLDDNVREAMTLPDQPQYIKTILHTTLKLAAWHVRYFHLPIQPAGLVESKLPDPSDGKPPLMHPKYYTSKPWYKPESKSFFGQVWDGPTVKSGKYEDVPSANFKSEGYRPDTLGPLRYEHAGQDEVFRMAETLQGCPISSTWRAK
ncbi:hypothetical protein Moror_4499 [Moniliophthora roreri MCA 2997]|uniref:ER-bound oxygenase mpaB/mpaB'/Rubber oxygenase catalytic domain-containing protein n=1 Tax=Moniliophthora roreri (strain MCA 2997) TaxID=1381753 RepID=V2XFG3_MONRO|nr:hypothetical protein Moror_4499 [Moniliophthora roreri MCA 2997]